jgi:ribosomal protein L11 methyltransferase
LASPPCGWERQSVAACDTDSLAVRATVENGRLNGLEGSIQVALGSVEALAPMLDGRSGPLLLCNILAPVIEALCPHFHTVLAPAGVGLLSGLLVEQAPELADGAGRGGLAGRTGGGGRVPGG